MSSGGSTAVRSGAGHRPASPKQKAFLRSLSKQLGLNYIRPLSMADAGEQIADLIALRDRDRPPRPDPPPPLAGWPAREHTKAWATNAEFAAIADAMSRRVVR